MSETEIVSRGIFVAGTWREAVAGGRIAVTNPATEATIVEIPYGSAADARLALESAQAGFQTWRKRTAHDRAGVLKRTAQLLRDRLETVSRVLTMEQGKPLAEARAETQQAVDTFEWFAEEAKRAYGQVIPQSVASKRHVTLKQPLGVVAAISPWNFPITLQARKIAPALAAGCSVVARPASQTPLSLTFVIDCLVEAGLPAGVVNMVTGPGPELAGEFLRNPICRKISFTGSTEVGKQLMRGAADGVKRLSLELGGHAPFILCADADPELAAELAVRSKFRNAGQACIAPSRFYVHRDLARKFTDASVDRARALRLGNGLDAGVEIGPMIERKSLASAEDLIHDAKNQGAKILTGGGPSQRFATGYFFEPTVLTNVKDSSRILVEEPFAPVMPLLEFSNLDEVIAAANNTRYGLASYCFTNDLSLAWKLAEELEAGIIGVNDPVPTTVQCPFGGMKESGLGRELAHDGLEAYFETKYVSFQLR